MSSRGELRMMYPVAVVVIVTAGCRPEVRVDAGATGTGGVGTGGATQGTSGIGGSGGDDQGASSSGAGGSDVDAGSGTGPSGYPDGGSPSPGTGVYCWSGDPCPPDEFCLYQHCGVDLPGPTPKGFCMKRPDTCTDDCPVVCGCDEKWYCNDCLAHAVGVSTGSLMCKDGGAP